MSDHGDYKEPKAGDWMLVIKRDADVVACMKVDLVDETDGASLAILSDGSAWGAETGQPLRRVWAGHYLWPVDKGGSCGDVVDMLYDASPEAFGEVYSVLLRDKRARAEKG